MKLALEKNHRGYEVVDSKHNTLGDIVKVDSSWRFKALCIEDYTASTLEKIAKMIREMK